jgi:phosphatidylglycerophosphatase A
MINRVCCRIATLGPIGYLPASGTCATLCTAAVLFMLAQLGVSSVLIKSFVLPLVAIGAIIIHYAACYLNRFDPPEIVLDEVIGYFFTMSLFPYTPFWFLATIIGFRFFDIVKPLGIKRVECIDGAGGILLDDLLAALYTQITLILCCIGYDLWIR